MKRILLAVTLVMCIVASLALVACTPVTYTLTLYDDDATTVLDTITVEEGKAPERPADPEKANFEFVDWFVTPTNATKYDFSKVLTEDAAASTLLINANFVPAELVLILTTKLFAGDANAPETGKPVGEITIKIPRFQLDGAFDLSMAMSAPATMSLNGTALAVSDGGCDDNGIYAEIVEVIESAKWYDGLTGIATEYGDYAAASELAAETQIQVFGVYKNMMPTIVAPANLTYTTGGTPGTGAVDATGKVTTAFVDGDTLTISINKEADGNEGAPTVSTVIKVIAD